MERLLITKLVRRPDGKVDLFGRGHKFKDLTLFDLTDLVDVGIDYDSLPTGTEEPCRFYAFYELSDKLNQSGNPYKDVVRLEPLDTPATSSSTDTSALLEELRAIRVLLERLVDGGAESTPGPASESPGEPDKATDNSLATKFATEYGDGAALDEDNETERRAFYDFIDRLGHVPENRTALREWFKEHGQLANGASVPRS